MYFLHDVSDCGSPACHPRSPPPGGGRPPSAPVHMSGASAPGRPLQSLGRRRTAAAPRAHVTAVGAVQLTSGPARAAPCCTARLWSARPTSHAQGPGHLCLTRHPR
eukprot:scaffold196_cov371-Prasinococcus_capsulatus_cf.AAC.2